MKKNKRENTHCYLWGKQGEGQTYEYLAAQRVNWRMERQIYFAAQGVKWKRKRQIYLAAGGGKLCCNRLNVDVIRRFTDTKRRSDQVVDVSAHSYCLFEQLLPSNHTYNHTN